MIRSKPPSDTYRDGWDRVFGGEPETRTSPDAIETKVRSWLWHCKACNAMVSDPENHQFHVTIDVSPSTRTHDE